MAKEKKKKVNPYKTSVMRRKEARNGLLFVLPWIIGFLAFTLYPIAASLYYSLCNYTVIKPPRFIGTANYRALFHDATFLASCRNTLFMICVGVPVTTVVAVSVSILLNYKKLRGTSWMRVVFFIPTLVNRLVQDKVACCKVLTTESKWFGVTYSADRQGVVDKFASLHADGTYPETLF